MEDSLTSRRRSQPAPLAPGVARVRLSGGTWETDALTAILRAHPAVEVLTGPDQYDDGRQYLTVRVRMDGGLGQIRSGVADLADARPAPALLRAPCGDYGPAEPYGPCTECGRTRYAHEFAAMAAHPPWTDDDEAPGGDS